MHARKSWLVLVLLVAVVAAVFLVPSLASAQACDPYHPETCHHGATTKAGSTFFVSETRPDGGSSILPIVAISLSVIGVALVARRLFGSASSGE